MPSVQGGVFRIRGTHLTEEAGGQSINVVVVSNDALHELGSVWFFPIAIAADPSAKIPPEYVRIDDLKQAKVAPNSFVDCANLNARRRAVLSDDANVGEREIGRLSRRDWRKVKQAMEKFSRDRR